MHKPELHLLVLLKCDVGRDVLETSDAVVKVTAMNNGAWAIDDTASRLAYHWTVEQQWMCTQP
jgi:hypothetical protein